MDIMFQILHDPGPQDTADLADVLTIFLGLLGLAFTISAKAGKWVWLGAVFVGALLMLATSLIPHQGGCCLMRIDWYGYPYMVAHADFSRTGEVVRPLAIVWELVGFALAFWLAVSLFCFGTTCLALKAVRWLR